MDHKLNKTTNYLDNESVLSSIMIDDDELINLENGKKQVWFSKSFFKWYSIFKWFFRKHNNNYNYK